MGDRPAKDKYRRSRTHRSSPAGRVGEEHPASLLGAAGATGAPEGRGDQSEFHDGETAADRNNQPVGRRPHQGHMKAQKRNRPGTASPAGES